MRLWQLARTTILVLLAVYAVAAIVSGFSILPRGFFPQWVKVWMPVIFVAFPPFDRWKRRRALNAVREVDATT